MHKNRVLFGGIAVGTRHCGRSDAHRWFRDIWAITGGVYRSSI